MMAAHRVDDEPQDDPAEEPMPAASFAIIGRAHELCGHPPARELIDEQHDCLLAHATKILSAQIRAGELVRQMKARGEWHDVEPMTDESAESAENIQNSYQHAADVLDDFADDEPDDWASVALAAWDAAGWKQAAQEYRDKRGKEMRR
jgi:hypothetical protein